VATISELARHLDMSSRNAHTLIGTGVIPKSERGAYDLDECRRHYLRHLENTAVLRALDKMAPTVAGIIRDRLGLAA
jgi:hypothetical protein